MVQMIENWAEIEGTLTNLAASPRLSDFVVADVEVATVTSVEGFRNLLEDAAGTTLHVNLPAQVADAAGLRPGVRVAMRVRRAGPPPTIFAHPDHVAVLG